MLKTKENMALQSRGMSYGGRGEKEGVGGKFLSSTVRTSVKFHRFVEQYLRSR